jgi:hypothetical protein
MVEIQCWDSPYFNVTLSGRTSLLGRTGGEVRDGANIFGDIRRAAGRGAGMTPPHNRQVFLVDTL